MTMKIIHVPFGYYPDPVGGTEVYVAALAQGLGRYGVINEIVAPGDAPAVYIHDDIPVRRFAVQQTVTDVSEFYGPGDGQAAAQFGSILDEIRPDLVHLHAFTRGVSLALARVTKRRGIPMVFTYHTPTVSCQRGTLMRWGDRVCDGRLRLDACTCCTLQGLGMSRRTAQIVGRIPAAVGHLIGRTRRSGGIWTALRMRSLMHLRHQTYRAFMDEMLCIVAVSRWVKEILLLHGLREDRIFVSRHGLPHAGDHSEASCISPHESPLHIAYLGRLDPTKGPDILIRAMRAVPEAPVALHLYGIVQGDAGDAYRRHLAILAEGDARIAFLPPVPNEQVGALLRRYHALAVPSRWLETGPIVVLEAFAAGLPVIGSNLGGIPEWVRDGIDGLLIDPEDTEAWGQAFQKLADDRAHLRKLTGGVCPPRDMDRVADEMMDVYHTVLQSDRSGTGL